MNLSLLLRSVILLTVIVASCTDSGDQSADDQQPPHDTTTEQSHGFDEMQESYYSSETRVIWQRPELVMNIMGPLEGKTVADIGAGTGYFAFRLAAAGAEVIAIDIDPRAISFMQSESNRYPQEVRDRFTTRLSQPEDPGLANGEVDIVLMVNTYIYISDRVSYFKRLQSGLQPNGEIVIIDFKQRETEIGPALEDRVALVDVQRELREAGYRVLEVDEATLEYQYMIKAVRQ